MKTCPVCQSQCFDDMEICYGCMYHFTPRADAGGTGLGVLAPTGGAPVFTAGGFSGEVASSAFTQSQSASPAPSVVQHDAVQTEKDGRDVQVDTDSRAVISGARGEGVSHQAALAGVDGGAVAPQTDAVSAGSGIGTRQAFPIMCSEDAATAAQSTDTVGTVSAQGGSESGTASARPDTKGSTIVLPFSDKGFEITIAVRPSA